jgi:hypothetical protein
VRKAKQEGSFAAPLKAGAAQDDEIYVWGGKFRELHFFVDRKISGLGYGPRGEELLEVRDEN